MQNPDSLLVQFSDALSGHAAGAQAFVAEVRPEDGPSLSGVLWRPNAVVVSEQALPDASEYQVRIADHSVKAHLAGRDRGTNVAVLKLDSEIDARLPKFAAPRLGALVLVLGVSSNGPAARLAIIRSVGESWESFAGGTIDHRITLDAYVGASEEGGPVLAADGGILGISTRGARRQSLVIPASTVDRACALLLEKGSIERGWLGVSLHPVALPETLRPEDSQRVGLMVMEVGADSPAAKAGVVAGDIILSVGGAPAIRLGKIARQFGTNSVGKTIEITLARAGAILTSKATITARTSG
jgi:S1-C subfamily serine protease